MRFENVVLETITHVIPPKIIRSSDIEDQLQPLYSRLGLQSGRLELMTGIHERRFWDGPMVPSRASADAGALALSKSAIPREWIDLLIHCAVCRDRLEPSTASTVHHHLNLSSHLQVFDVSNACLGFLNGIIIAAGLIESGQIRAALLVAGENGRPLLDQTIDTLLHGEFTRKSVKPYFANLTIGACAVAAVLCHKSFAHADGPRVTGAIVETDTHYNHLCHGDSIAGGGLEMITESELLLDAGISVAERAWRQFLCLKGWDIDNIDRVICHQVGRAHQRRLLETIGLPESKDFVSYPILGNTGSAALPVTLSLALDANMAPPGSKVALLGIGSGISSVMLALET